MDRVCDIECGNSGVFEHGLVGLGREKDVYTNTILIFLFLIWFVFFISFFSVFYPFFFPHSSSSFSSD